MAPPVAEEDEAEAEAVVEAAADTMGIVSVGIPPPLSCVSDSLSS